IRDGGGAHVRAPTTAPVSQNVDHNRHSSRRRSSGHGGRTSAGDAARSLDLANGNSVAGERAAGLDGNVVRGFPNRRNADRTRTRRGSGGRLVLGGPALQGRRRARDG